MRYTLTELLEDKKLRSAVAEQAYAKTLDFEDGNGVFALDFRGQSLRLNLRQVYDRLCELGGEKLLKKLMKEEKSCLTDKPEAAKSGVCAIRGTEKYFLLTNAGASKIFASILRGIAGWAKMDKTFDMELVAVSDGEAQEETADGEEFSVLEDWDSGMEHRWFHQGRECSAFMLEPVRNGVLAEKNGRLIFVDAISNKEIYLTAISRLGGMNSCEPLRAEDDESTPVMGYKYQAEENGKWGFVSPRFAYVTAPRYDDIVATKSLVVAWAEREEGAIDLTIAVDVVQEETGVADIWLSEDAPEFRNVDALYKPLYYAALDENPMEDGRVAYLYQSSSNLKFGLFQKAYAGQWGDAREVRCYEGFITGDGFEEKIPANCLNLEKCLQLGVEKHGELWVDTCITEPEWSGIGTYIIRKDGFWALADLDVSGGPAIVHLLTPLAYTKMVHPKDWPEQLVLLERFGKKGIYHWMKEEFLASCEYESIQLRGDFFYLTRHSKTRAMWISGAWVAEEKPRCPKCRTELVKGALYCHMCGMSLMEPEKKAEPKPEKKEEPKLEPKPEPKVEMVQEAPRPVESPKGVEPPKPVVPSKPPMEVPTKHTFKDNFIRMGRMSAVSDGRLIVNTQYNEKREEHIEPEYHLYGDMRIAYYKNKVIGEVVDGLSGLSAYALGENGIFYAKNNEIWYLTTDGNRRKLGEQKKIIGLIDEGNGKLTVEYVESYHQTEYDEYRDRDYYEVWYDGYDVNKKKFTLTY